MVGFEISYAKRAVSALLQPLCPVDLLFVLEVPTAIPLEYVVLSKTICLTMKLGRNCRTSGTNTLGGVALYEVVES